MSAEERAKLPHNERRAFHRGNHDKVIVNQIRAEMDEIVEVGRSSRWVTAQYYNELSGLVSSYRKQLKQGNIALNKHYRGWAVRL